MLGQGGLGLPDRDYYLKDDPQSKEIRAKYLAHIAKMLELLGRRARGGEGEGRGGAGPRDALAQAPWTRVELRDPEKNYNKRTLDQLGERGPGLRLEGLLRRAGVSAGRSSTSASPPSSRPSASSPPKCRSPPGGPTSAGTPSAPQRRTCPRPSGRRPSPSSGKVLNGTPEREARWKRVEAATDSTLGEALGQLYVEKAFPPKSKERVKDLVENLRAALQERITTLAWMGADTKQQALKKLTAFGVKIGYPDKWKTTRLRDQPRRLLRQRRARAHAFEGSGTWRKLGKPIDRTEWGMTPPTVNAYYSPTMNEIVFPAGILQPPFFDAKADDAVNYGAIGFVIGHEMTHGFDDTGSQYDADGNLKNWWTDADKKAYEARTDLVVKQYDAYKPLPDQAINGKLTLGENIADLGGLKIAFAASQKASARPAGGDHRRLHPGPALLPGLAAIWRNHIRDEALRVRLKTDPHSPGK